MKIVDKILAKQADLRNAPAVTIAFLGDSVTQGCFDLYLKKDNSIETFFNQNDAFHRDLGRLLSLLYPTVPFNMINAGISGDNAPSGVKRLTRDVLCRNADLVVVCYGLNDACSGMDGLPAYREALKNIFDVLKQEEIETIFMTPNMMCTSVSCHLKEPAMQELAQRISDLQNNGTMDRYMETAREVCGACDLPICDCYSKWKCLQENGVDTTELPANYVNHPVKELHWLFASALVETMFR